MNINIDVEGVIEKKFKEFDKTIDQKIRACFMELKWYTPNEAAKHWRVTPQTVLKRIKTGMVKAKNQQNGRWLIHWNDIDNLQPPQTFNNYEQ